MCEASLWKKSPIFGQRVAEHAAGDLDQALPIAADVDIGQARSGVRMNRPTGVRRTDGQEVVDQLSGERAAGLISLLTF